MVDQDDLYPKISTFHSPLDHVSSALIGDRELIEKHLILVKSHAFFDSTCFAFSFFVSCLRPMPRGSFCALVNWILS